MKKIPTPSQLFRAIAPSILAALFLTALPCQADAPRTPTQRENRFLFIVDTSAAMRGYSNAVVQGVLQLLQSDMKGEFRQGDTIGLWTYNDKLHTGFPMQVWSKADKDSIVESIAAWLAAGRAEKRAHLEKVMPALSQLIKNSERLTVILISDGTGLIQGTPFDKDINALRKKYGRELRAAGVPFVVVLVARDGAVFDYTINYPGLVAIPHTAYPEKPVETNAPPPVVAAIPIPVTNAPARPRRTNSIIMLAPTNAVHAAAPKPPSAVEPVPAPVPVVNTPAPPPVVPVAAPPANQPVANLNLNPNPVFSVPSPPAYHPAKVVPMPSPPLSQQENVVPMPSPPENLPASAAPVPSPRELARPQTQPAPAPIVARQNSPQVNETPLPQTPPVNVTANDQQPPPSPPVAPIAPVANIVPSSGTQFALFVIAFSLLTIAVALVIFLIHRSRRGSQSSLITQSIDPPR